MLDPRGRGPGAGVDGRSAAPQDQRSTSNAAMADLNAKLISIPYTIAGETGCLKMALGTYTYLFGTAPLPAAANFRTYELPSKTYTRHAWAGGPAITVTRDAQTVQRAVGTVNSTAKSEKKLVLTADGISDTIYYTGRVFNAVKYLKDNASANPVPVSIEGARGTKYNVIPAN